MNTYSPIRSSPLTLSSSVESQVYSLFAFAMGITALGIYIGMQYANVLLTSGIFFLLFIAEFALILTSRWWMDKSPFNYLLFGLFPLLSGITVVPFLLYVLEAYTNGGSILLNAFLSTAFMAGAAAVVARSGMWNLGTLGRALFFSLLGLVILGLIQLFVPALQTSQMEILLSGAGVIIFAGFTAYDIQRIQQQSKAGANPFLMALSLYLDIFNLFMYVVRFMLAVSGNRRN
jgi:FtsH-binding integral membrane protein